MYWVTGFFGVFLIIVPYFMNYNTNTGALWGSLVVGFFAIGISIIEWLHQNKEDWEYWGIGVLAVAEIFAPFILSFTSNTNALWTSILWGVVLGFIVIVKLFVDESNNVPFIRSQWRSIEGKNQL